MNKDRLFQFLGKNDSSTLLKLLSEAYDFLSHDDRDELFGEYVQELPPSKVDGDSLLAEIEQFDKSSRAGHYYESFNIDSKNYMDVPEETEKWFEKIGDYFQDSCQLTAQGDYQNTVSCFGLLNELVDEMEDGEIVFADELGSWMIPGDEKQHVTAYLTALVATTTPEVFADVVTPLVKRDSWQSFYGKVYETAVRLANDAQKAMLDAEIQRLNIRTKPEE
ncbi:MAG: hypothetical protein GY943_20720 [Chloroflexi bacterium]|nr:hypothetical protein [Chloroflexota bacterium]